METVLITITETLPVALEAELELASDFARASKAKATQMAYSSDFRIFEPGAASAVCAFLAAQAGLGKWASTLGRRLASIKYFCDEPNSEPQRRWHRFRLRPAPIFRGKPEDHGRP